MEIDCSSSWQWEFANNGSVEFDADIVGPGVIASFISAALTALLTLIVAFATYSIPEELINDVDGVFARALRSIFSSLRNFLHIPSISKTEVEEAREDRLRAFQTFMLSISDQVLASEMAILIATFAKFIDITLYSVNVVVALGCLASTVHLAMMPLLVGQMREHHVIKASRSVSMVIAAIMLVMLLILQISETWRDGTHIYFQCAFMDYQLGGESLSYNWMGFVTQLLIPMFIIYGNYEIIRLLYSRSYQADTEDSTPADTTTKVPSKRTRLAHVSKELAGIRTYSEQSRIRRQWAQHKARAIIRKKLTLKQQRLQAFFIAETMTFYECQESFLWRILWLLSGNVYGLTDVFSTRSDTEGISGERDSMGYGQIVPLVLLILPVFAAMQSIYDYQDRIKASKQPQPNAEQTLAAIPESQAETETEAGMEMEMQTISSHEAPLSSVVIENQSAPQPLSRSSTTATENPSFSGPALRRRQSALSSSSTLNTNANDETLPGVFMSPTLDTARPPSPSQGTMTGIDKSLWHWAQQDAHPSSFSENPFIRTTTYAHAIFMLIFLVLFGWAMADPGSPDLLTLALEIILLLLVVRRLMGLFYFWQFSRKHLRNGPGSGFQQGQQQQGSSQQQPPADNSQAMMQAHAANETAAGDEDE